MLRLMLGGGGAVFAWVSKDVTDMDSRGCGSHRSDAEVASAQRTFETHRLSPPSEDSTAVIDVYFHVVHANNTIEGGYVP